MAEPSSALKPATEPKLDSTSEDPKPSPSQPPPPPPPKKIPPLPWTHLETVNLIEVYQQKWYSLKRGQLKANQWEEVSATVASRCGFEEPSKTSTQCRHKMEKLRKRYRSEKQRPCRSNWAYFDLMDLMERGPFPISARPLPSIDPRRHHRNSEPIVCEDEEDEEDDDEDDNEGDDNVPDAANKSRSINHILQRPPVVSRIVEDSNASIMPRQYSRIGDGDLGVSRFSRNPIFGKRKFPFQIEEEVEVVEEEDEQEDEEGGGGGEEAIMQLASVVREFGEGFVKIEHMKMEMMRETERYRMEMETRRTAMILESQRRIVDTIAKALCTQKKSKKVQGM